jgi:hypothetical protein
MHRFSTICARAASSLALPSSGRAPVSLSTRAAECRWTRIVTPTTRAIAARLDASRCSLGGPFAPATELAAADIVKIRVR